MLVPEAVALSDGDTELVELCDGVSVGDGVPVPLALLDWLDVPDWDENANVF